MKLDLGPGSARRKPGPGRTAVGRSGAGARSGASKPSDTRKIVLAAAAAEARRRGDRRLGTDHLMLGLLRDGDPLILRSLGVSLTEARAAAAALDRAALAAVGVQTADSLDGGLPEPPGHRPLPPLTSGARGVLRRAADKARAGPVPGMQPRHLLLALLALEPPDPAAQLLAALDVQAWEARNRMIGGG